MNFQNILPGSRELALSMGLEALIQQAAIEQDGQLTAQALAACALRLYPEKVVQQHLESLAERLAARVKRLADTPPPAVATDPEQTPKHSVGTFLQNWVNGLDPTSLCLYLADFDPEKAYRLYWWTDLDLVEEALQAKIVLESVKHMCNYEASVYGFGGSFNDAKAEEPENLPELGSPEAAFALRSMGLNF